MNSINYIINYSNTDEVNNLCSKINSNVIRLSEIANVNNGVLAYEVGAGYPKQTEQIRNNRLYHSKLKHDNNWIKYVDGIDVKRYFIGWSGQFIKYGENLSRPRKSELFNGERVLVRQIPSSPPYSIFAAYVDENLVNDNNSMIVTIKNQEFDIKYILAILNSKLTSFWFLKIFGKLQRKLFPQFKVNELSLFPIKASNIKAQEDIKTLADHITDFNKALNYNVEKLHNNLKNNFELIKITSNLANFHFFDFKSFIHDLKKQKITLSLKQQDEWEDYFNDYKQKITDLKRQIDQTDREIDQMVYQLYGLTPEEIEIVERS